MTPDAQTPGSSATTDLVLLAGRYQLLDKLGQGGMGTVYRARDNQLDRLVAVKILPAATANDSDAIARFQREARALAKLSHPHIIQAHDSGVDQGQHFLVMELVEGRSLARELAEQGKIAPTRAADFAHQAALALHHAHRHGLIHRDVKPSNLLLGKDGQVKLLDLGLARFIQDQVTDGTLTKAGTGMGTPDYSAPEQFRDARAADRRSDVYALGCTLYHLIGGRVPFPGSSLSEKVTAHETKEPTPLEELCPEVPGGLALTVQHMMAKRPADRFQNMAELAEALTPYVAGSSASFQSLRNTSSWDGSRLSTVTAPAPSRRRRTYALAGAAAAAMAFLLIGFFTNGFGLLSANSTEPDDNGADARTASEAGKADKLPAATVDDDPNVLTVSKDAKDKARFDSINAALEKVKPGQTVRVLDDAEYEEVITFNRMTEHRGITLEAVRRATLAPPTERMGIAVLGVPDVTIRGFRMRADRAGVYLILVGQRSPGIVLEDLEFEPKSAADYVGIDIEQLELQEGDLPVVVQNCTMRRAGMGIRLSGIANDYKTAAPTGPIVIRNNTLVDSEYGLKAMGAVHHCQIVGNRFLGNTSAAIHLEHLFPESRALLIANNTMLGGGYALRLWDTALKGEDLTLANNLILGSQRPDMVFMRGQVQQQNPEGPGDGAAVRDHWKLRHNWREVREPKGSGLDEQSWIAPDPSDVRGDSIPVVSRVSAHPDFLRPAKDSPLATEGAGKTNPRLPSYVGAVLPEGVSPWDWDRTWRMPKDAQLLTVSKEEKDGGQFRTINEALKAAKPWATVRVLDDAEYAESLMLDQPRTQAGLSLEAPKRATFVLTSDDRHTLRIENVPFIHVSGFRFRSQSARDSGRFISVQGQCTGAILEDLDLQARRSMIGMTLQNIHLLPSDSPVIVRRCAVDVRAGDGISLIGAQDASSPPLSGIRVQDNRVTGALRGIPLRGGIADVHITGNLVWSCDWCGIHLEDCLPENRAILIANNTLFACEQLFRVWDNEPLEENHRAGVQLRSNVALEANTSDFAFLLSSSKDGSLRGGDGRQLIQHWSFSHNWRDLSGSEPAAMIPLAPLDRREAKMTFLSRAADQPDFMRPAADSPLATGGAGKDDPSLPIYVGAVPPKGTPVWDWDKTWRWRMKRIHRPDAEKKP